MLAAWAGPEGWRKRREAWYAKSKPVYDAYPSHETSPEIRFYVEARDARGRLIREYVDLEGYSVHQLNWRPGARRGNQLVRDWFIGQMLEAMLQLSKRLDVAREEHDARSQP